jgi:hypothetical protein
VGRCSARLLESHLKDDKPPSDPTANGCECLNMACYELVGSVRRNNDPLVDHDAHRRPMPPYGTYVRREKNAAPRISHITPVASCRVAWLGSERSRRPVKVTDEGEG